MEANIPESDDVRTGLISGETFGSKSVTYAAVDEIHLDTGAPTKLAVCEGCIAIGTVDEIEAETVDIQSQADSGEGAVGHGVGITGRRAWWLEGVVSYEIAPALPNKQHVNAAIDYWHAETRIRLMNCLASNVSRYPDYVQFRPSDGCLSNVGRLGGRKDIGLASGCGAGSALTRSATPSDSGTSRVARIAIARSRSTSRISPWGDSPQPIVWRYK